MNFIKHLFFMTIASIVPLLAMEPPTKKSISDDIISMVENGQTEELSQRLNEFTINAEFGAENQTLLHRAVLSGQRDVVSLLLDRGAPINAPDRNGLTPLFLAFESIDRPNMITLATDLIERGADATIKSKTHGTSLLHLLARYGLKVNSDSLAQLAIKKGADITAIDNEGNTAADLAINYNNAPLLRAVLIAGIPLEIIITPRRSLRSISTSRPEIGRLLLQFGAFADNAAIDILYPFAAPTKLERQAALCSVAGLKMALQEKEKGGNVGDISKALLIAIGQRCLDGVKLLLQHGTSNISEALSLVEAILARKTEPWHCEKYEAIREALRHELMGIIMKTFFAQPIEGLYFQLLPTELKRMLLALFSGRNPTG
jgi:hypothetical protein